MYALALESQETDEKNAEGCRLGYLASMNHLDQLFNIEVLRHQLRFSNVGREAAEEYIVANKY